MTTTFDWLRLTLAKDYKLDPALLKPDASLETLGLDSLAVAELLFTVEDKFKITVSPELVPLATLADVVRFIEAHVDAQQGTASTQVPSAPASQLP
ncbi:acyl carrier protein [Caballeronia sp. LjRoot29]|uniref:acyl carrier protein n=1 Tax=Caballeronia sp. LjRoot29 TaxID=3342315 RepID=UPI003ECF14CC